MEHLYNLWLLLMLSARCQEVTYLLNDYHSLCSFCGFTGRFMDQQGNKGSSGSAWDIAYVRGILVILDFNYYLCLFELMFMIMHMRIVFVIQTPLDLICFITDVIWKNVYTFFNVCDDLIVTMNLLSNVCVNRNFKLIYLFECIFWVRVYI